jgi:hypothetical protein
MNDDEIIKHYCICCMCNGMWYWSQDEFRENHSCPACGAGVWAHDRDQREAAKAANFTKRSLGL